MPSAAKTDWPTCTVEGCSGARGETGHCIAHLSGTELADAFEEIGRTGKVDARGTVLDPSLLGRILEGVPRTRDGRRRFVDADFRSVHLGATRTSAALS